MLPRFAQKGYCLAQAGLSKTGAASAAEAPGGPARIKTARTASEILAVRAVSMSNC
jgi:hypothetical protein